MTTKRTRRGLGSALQVLDPDASSPASDEVAAPAPPVPRGANPPAGDVVLRIPLDDLEVGRNVRKDPSALDELADSIREHGVLQPIRVRRREDGRPGYLVVWGQRRTLAARLAGLERIPAIITSTEYTRAELAIEQLAENLQRQDLNPFETALALRQVLDAEEMSHADLAKRLGRSRPWVSNALRLLETCEAVQAALAAGEIGASHAEACVGLDEDDQLQVLKEAKEGATSKRLEQLAGDLRRTAADRTQRRQERQDLIRQALEVVAAAVVEGPVGKLFASCPPDVRQALVDAGHPLSNGHQYHDFDLVKTPCCPAFVLIGWRPGDVGLKHACTSKAHKKARTPQEQPWQREERERRAARAKERAELIVTARPVVERQLRSTQVDRVVLLSLAQFDRELEQDLVKRYFEEGDGVADEEADDDGEYVDDLARAVVDGIPDLRVADELAAAVSRFVASTTLAGARGRLLELLGLGQP